MKKLLRFLWTGSWHDHYWEVYKSTQVLDEDNECIGDKYTLRCKHCGEMKLFKTSIGL